MVREADRSRVAFPDLGLLNYSDPLCGDPGLRAHDLGYILPLEERGNDFTVNDIKEEFDDLNSKVNRMEDDVVDKEKDWEHRFKEDK